VGLSGCATGEALYADAETIERQLNAARRQGAYRCAPQALAQAEAHLEFLRAELAQGNAVRAAEHREVAKTRMFAALEGSRDCAVKDVDGDGVPDESDACPQTPGLPGLSGCPDRDGDGLADGDDACPTAAGPAALQGCPDIDGDGIPDGKDTCPNEPEDFDGIEDQDGCPEREDTDADGILDVEDDCPRIPGPLDNRGCPLGDRDRDEIPDREDSCPDDREDVDGFEDADGCPDPDNDGDGVPDRDDICPLEAETDNGFEDADGCPDVKLELVEVKRDIGKIEIKQKVYFDTGKATIKPVSFAVLNEVAAVLEAYPTMTVMVEGHTDSTGPDSLNLRLSQARAESVRTYLTAQGIASERLTAIGFGEEKPIAPNASADGREQNRRVEFTITGE
jgi:outer membrane protein OmpA-like peptidoglycan-associated protein